MVTSKNAGQGASLSRRTCALLLRMEYLPGLGRPTLDFRKGFRGVEQVGGGTGGPRLERWMEATWIRNAPPLGGTALEPGSSFGSGPTVSIQPIRRPDIFVFTWSTPHPINVKSQNEAPKQRFDNQNHGNQLRSGLASECESAELSRPSVRTAKQAQNHAGSKSKKKGKTVNKWQGYVRSELRRRIRQDNGNPKHIDATPGRHGRTRNKKAHVDGDADKQEINEPMCRVLCLLPILSTVPWSGVGSAPLKNAPAYARF